MTVDASLILIAVIIIAILTIVAIILLCIFVSRMNRKKAKPIIPSSDFDRGH